MAGLSAHELVDTPEKAAQAIDVLRTYNQLSVDCEGVNLGRDGELCLLQVATPNKVYLFDVIQLKEKVFDLGLKSILENSGITKLFYDCRQDCNALQHQYNVVVTGIEDIQLLNTLDMKLRGKRSQCVSGLQKTLDYHMRGCGFSGQQKERMHRALDNDKTLWTKRPLSDEFLAYAATDVFFLSRLRDKLYQLMSVFGDQGDLQKVVKYASNRYADFMRNNSAYTRESPYFCNARLPERIIPDLRKIGYSLTFVPFSDATGRNCRSCNWKTDTRCDGQCRRCCLIDNPTQF